MMNTKPIVDVRPLTIDLVRDNIDYLVQISAQLQGDYWNLEHYLSDLKRKWDLSMATFADNKFCGFIIVSEKPESLHVHRIVIDNGMQGYGIGKMLILKTAEHARLLNKDAITLKAEAGNAKTLGFYTGLGFEITGDQGVLILLTLKLAS